MRCPTCQTALAPRATFCGGCGRAVDDPLIGAMVGGRYRVEQRIAVGGFGSIYRATHRSTGRAVALKVMHRELAADAQLVARFRREAAALCSLRDAHTVTTYELDTTADGQLVIAMELLTGRTALDALREEGPLPWRRALAIARGVCSALTEAHALGIVHRDLKPANLFLEERRGEEVVKVLDFGIAKLMQSSGLHDGSELTVLGEAVGTLEYMAPEQIMGGACDGRTDLYALGVVMYELLTGARPFAAVASADLLATQLARSPAPPSAGVALPPAVDRMVLRCLARDVDDRFPSSALLSAAIDEVLARPDTALGIARSVTSPGVAVPRGIAVTPPRGQRAPSPPAAAWSGTGRASSSGRSSATAPGGFAGVTAPMEAAASSELPTRPIHAAAAPPDEPAVPPAPAPPDPPPVAAPPTLPDPTLPAPLPRPERAPSDAAPAAPRPRPPQEPAPPAVRAAANRARRRPPALVARRALGVAALLAAAAGLGAALARLLL